jgi:hypothetical protein
MRFFGWRSAISVAGIIGSAAVAVAVIASRSGTIRVDQGYYQAAASIIPLLLLGHIVRLNTLRAGIFDDRARLDQRIDQQQERIWIAGAEREVAAKTSEIKRQADAISSTALELVVGNFIITLIMGSAGIAATLIALAHGSGSPTTLFLSMCAIFWGLLGMLVVELLLFLR